MPYIGKKPADIIATVIDTTTGTFSGDLTVDTNTLYVDSANNRVGVGTVSPSQQLTVSNTSGGSSILIKTDTSSGGNILFGDTDSDVVGRVGYNHSTNYLYFHSNGSERARIDSSGRVGIGTSSPSQKLQVSGAGSQYVSVVSTDSGNTGVLFGDSGQVDQGYVLYANSDDSLRIGTSNTERMRIDSSGNVGIGASSTDALESRTAFGYRSLRLNNFNITAGESSYGFVGQNIYQDSAGVYKFIDTGDSSSIHFWGDAMQFHMANGSADATQSGSEKMRLDSSGNLLVGTTNSVPGAGNTAVGASIYNDGRIFLSKSANTVASFNRNTSDGVIGEFRRDGTAVGSIGTNSQHSKIAMFDSSGGFILGTTGLLPSTSAGAYNGGQRDLGTASVNWKDLYLSGSAIVGGLTVDAATNKNFLVQGGTGDVTEVLNYSSSDGYRNLLFGGSVLRFETGAGGGSSTSERMRIDSSGNVGIGITPTNTFHVGASGTVTSRYTSTDTGAFSLLRFENTGSIVLSADHGNTQSNSNIVFQRDGATESMRIDSSGNVGIGIAPQSFAKLQVKTATDRNVAFFSNAAGATIGGLTDAGASTSLRLAGAALVMTGGGGSGSEHMRIDSSGNLLVGKTSTSTTVEGVVMHQDGFVGITRSLGNPLSVLRRDSDGDIIQFYKDATNVGSIASRAGTVSTIILDPTATGGGISGGGAALYPTDHAGTLSDGALTLGDASYRWNNLYLSGGVYLGGTGSANFLDDYEEGTWTPAFSNVGSPSYSHQYGRYTKVGRIVHLFLTIHATSVSGSGTATITGLPFTATETGDSQQRHAIRVANSGHLSGLSTSTARFRVAGNQLIGVKDDATTTYLSASELTSSGTIQFSGQITFFVA